MNLQAIQREAVGKREVNPLILQFQISEYDKASDKLLSIRAQDFGFHATN